MTEGTSRMDAFSDSVFAIAITLLILEIRLPHTAEEPHPAGESLRHVLLALWPSFFAFALSFFIILVSWITHHELIRLVRGTNNAVMLANGTVLAYVTFLPFSTTVLATHLGGPETPTAVAFYCRRSSLAISRSTCRSRRSRATGCFARRSMPSVSTAFVQLSHHRPLLCPCHADCARRAVGRARAHRRGARVSAPHPVSGLEAAGLSPLCQMRPNPLKSIFLPRVIPRARSVPR